MGRPVWRMLVIISTAVLQDRLRGDGHASRSLACSVAQACHINPRPDTHRCKLQLHCRHSCGYVVVGGKGYETSGVVLVKLAMQATRSRPPVLQATLHA